MRLTGLFSWYLFAIVTGGSVGTERNISPVLQHSDIDLWLFHLITSNNLGVDLLNPGFPLLSSTVSGFFCPTESYCIARVRYVYLTLHVGFILD